MSGIMLLKRITQSKIYKQAASFLSDFGSKSIAANSASIAYYVFLSLIPLFILLCSQLPMTGIGKYELLTAVKQFLPETVADLVSSIISEAYRSRIGLFSFSMVVLLWSSSRGVVALVRSLDIVYDVQDSRSLIDLYMFSIFYTICLLLGISMLLFLYTKEITAEELIRSTMQSDKIYETVVPQLKKLYIIFGGIMLCMIIYKVAPAQKRGFFIQLPGAVFSSVAISLFSVFFAAYTGGSNIYNSFYGSLTTVSLFLLWMYSCINIFLIGGVINAHFDKEFTRFFIKIKGRIRRRHREKKAKKEKTSAGISCRTAEDEQC